MASKAKILRPEIQTAKDLYVWLWISLLFTLPTNFILYQSLRFVTNHDSPLLFIAVIGSALWHLILLIPAIWGRSEFIRWHGRQALLLAILRTTVALEAVGSIIEEDSRFILGFLLLVVLWLASSLWGQAQAKRGDCTLMRWSGHGAGLPLSTLQESGSTETLNQPDEPIEIDRLVENFRFNPDPEKRRAALAKLEFLGLVETL